jgi:hypothetical protein
MFFLGGTVSFATTVFEGGCEAINMLVDYLTEPELLMLPYI